MKRSFTIPRNKLDGVLALLSVARHKSFRAAAAELGVSPSAVSQTVRAVEARAGVALLTRTTRKVGLTEAGLRFVERARPAVEELVSAFEAAQAFSETVKGLLRLNVPRGVASYFAELMVNDFCAAYPDVQVEIFAEDRLIDIVEEGYDAGVRMGQRVEADMIAIRLTPPFPFAVVGAPAYFAQHSRPRKPEDLQSHRCVGFRSNAHDALYRWEFERKGRQFDVGVSGPIIVNDWSLAITSAARELGLAYVPLPMAQPYIQDGRLETVLEAFCPERPGLFLYYPNRTQALPKLRAFAEFARNRLSPLPK